MTDIWLILDILIINGLMQEYAGDGVLDRSREIFRTAKRGFWRPSAWRLSHYKCDIIHQNDRLDEHNQGVWAPPLSYPHPPDPE